MTGPGRTCPINSGRLCDAPACMWSVATEDGDACGALYEARRIAYAAEAVASFAYAAAAWSGALEVDASPMEGELQRAAGEDPPAPAP